MDTFFERLSRRVIVLILFFFFTIITLGIYPVYFIITRIEDTIKIQTEILKELRQMNGKETDSFQYDGGKATFLKNK